MQNIVFVLCEGPHDVAFLYRILRTVGFKNYSEKIKDFPEPMDSFIIQSVKKTAIEEMKLEEIRSRPIPSEALAYRNDSLFLMYSVHGDSKKPVRKKIIESVSEIIPTDPDGFNPLENVNFSILYFFDADNRGIAGRLQEIKSELAEFSKSKTDDDFTGNACFHEIDGIRYGAYIFAKKDGKGNLEDILLPLMKEDNQEIFEKAEQYLELKKDDSRLKKLKIQEKGGKITEKRTGGKMKFDLLKSEICVAGQLQNSGKSNVVIIKDCDYITLNKINDSHECQEIVKFFKKCLRQ
ncbi:MAG: hypothetical protein DRI57_01700 [Deltaproteobacteria bacterium]|nr:MAG: hypothetical protein DRI57_01700 [Deltaproteobacteria bacterium]